MTFQPPASAPVTLPDLTVQHDRTQKQFRTARLVALIGLGVMAFVLACIPLVTSPGPKGLIGGLAVFLLVVLLFGGLALGRLVDLVEELHAGSLSRAVPQVTHTVLVLQ